MLRSNPHSPSGVFTQRPTPPPPPLPPTAELKQEMENVLCLDAAKSGVNPSVGSNSGVYGDVGSWSAGCITSDESGVQARKLSTLDNKDPLLVVYK